MLSLNTDIQPRYRHAECPAERAGQPDAAMAGSNDLHPHQSIHCANPATQLDFGTA